MASETAEPFLYFITRARAFESVRIEHTGVHSGTRLRPMAAPKVSEMGGGISRADAGVDTQTYVDYFEGDFAAGKDASKRKANYTDVVNKCVRGRGREADGSLRPPAAAPLAPVFTLAQVLRSCHQLLRVRLVRAPAGAAGRGRA